MFQCTSIAADAESRYCMYNIMSGRDHHIHILDWHAALFPILPNLVCLVHQPIIVCHRLMS